jgi:hypothetical protein
MPATRRIWVASGIAPRRSPVRVRLAPSKSLHRAGLACAERRRAPSAGRSQAAVKRERVRLCAGGPAARHSGLRAVLPIHRQPERDRSIQRTRRGEGQAAHSGCSSLADDRMSPTRVVGATRPMARQRTLGRGGEGRQSGPILNEMLDPCLTPDHICRPERRARRPAFGSSTGVWAMELGGLEPPTSWVRSKALCVNEPRGKRAICSGFLLSNSQAQRSEWSRIAGDTRGFRHSWR